MYGNTERWWDVEGIHELVDDVVSVEAPDLLSLRHHFGVGVVEDSDDDVEENDVSDEDVETVHNPHQVLRLLVVECLSRCTEGCCFTRIAVTLELQIDEILTIYMEPRSHEYK